MSPDVAASVRARLLNQARQRGEEFERTLARFAGERLLFRLGACAARDRWILKGAAFLDRETARLDALIAKVREAIALLKELRTALISAAVTGKIDVREKPRP